MKKGIREVTLILKHILGLENYLSLSIKTHHT